jgi:hypothetical protein
MFTVTGRIIDEYDEASPDLYIEAFERRYYGRDQGCVGTVKSKRDGTFFIAPFQPDRQYLPPELYLIISNSYKIIHQTAVSRKITLRNVIEFDDIVIRDPTPFDDPYDDSEYRTFRKFASIKDTLELDKINYDIESKRLTRLISRWKSFAKSDSHGYFPQVPRRPQTTPHSDIVPWRRMAQ